MVLNFEVSEHPNGDHRGGTSKKGQAYVATVIPPAAFGRFPTLQLIASVSGLQDMRLHHGPVTLTAGCNRDCSPQVSEGARLGSRTIALKGLNMSMSAGHAASVSLQLSAAELHALACDLGPTETATGNVMVLARAPGQPTQTYLARVRLSYR